MNYKFKIGDVVCPKIDYAEYKEKHFLCPRNLFIITDYVETSKDEYLAHNERRKILLCHGYIYVVRRLIEDCGSADIAFKKEYSKEENLMFYTDDDGDMYIQEAKEIVLTPNWEKSYKFHYYPATEDDYDEFGNLINDGYLKWLD